MSGSRKRKATTESSESFLKSLDRLSDWDKDSILRELIKNPSRSARDLVVKKSKTNEKPLTEELLKSFGSRAYQAIHQLDRLRPSQQFEMVGTVDKDLYELVKEAKQFTPVAQLCCLARISGVFSHSVDTGEVFKGISSDSGLQYTLCQDMLEALQNVKDLTDEIIDQLTTAKSQLERVHARLTGYGIDDFEEVVQAIGAMITGDDGDDDGYNDYEIEDSNDSDNYNSVESDNDNN